LVVREKNEKAEYTTLNARCTVRKMKAAATNN